MSSPDWVDVNEADLQTSEDDEPHKGVHAFTDSSPSDLDESSGDEAATHQPLHFPDSNGEELESKSAFAQPAQFASTDSHSSIDFDAHALTEQPPSQGTDQERWQSTDLYMRDIQQACRPRPAVKVNGNDRYMKILLVGEQGLGKEAFIKNIFAPYCADNDLSVNVCNVDTSLHDFRDKPAEFCTEVVIDVDEGRTMIHYLMQDSPGTHILGCERQIAEYIRKQNKAYMDMEEDSKRSVPMNAMPDPRVDVALYFLSPFFLKPQDISAIEQLSKFVPVIPVIAKADALTTQELTAYRLEVRTALDEASERVGRNIVHLFSSSELKDAGAVRDLPPFAIITSSEVENEVGRHWFTRTFPWGKCEVLSSNHSDLPALKSLLFEGCFESIKAATEARFYAARESHLTHRALSKALSSPDTSRPKSVVAAETVAAVKAAQPARQPPRKPTAKKVGWSFGWTAGLVTVAVLVQLLALGYYSRNMTALKNMVDTYQAESAAEKQELQELLRGRLQMITDQSSQPSAAKAFFIAAGTSLKTVCTAPVRGLHALSSERPLWAHFQNSSASEMARVWRQSAARGMHSLVSTISVPFRVGFSSSRSSLGELAHKTRILTAHSLDRLANSLHRVAYRPGFTLKKPTWSGIKQSSGSSLRHLGSGLRSFASMTAKGHVVAARVASRNIVVSSRHTERFLRRASVKTAASLQNFGFAVAYKSKPLQSKLSELTNLAGTKIFAAGKATEKQMLALTDKTGMAINEAASATVESLSKTAKSAANGVSMLTEQSSQAVRNGLSKAGQAVGKAAFSAGHNTRTVLTQSLSQVQHATNSTGHRIGASVKATLNNAVERMNNTKGAKRWLSWKILRRSLIAAVLQ